MHKYIHTDIPTHALTYTYVHIYIHICFINFCLGEGVVIVLGAGAYTARMEFGRRRSLKKLSLNFSSGSNHNYVVAAKYYGTATASELIILYGLGQPVRNIADR